MADSYVFSTEALSVGYKGKALINDINIRLEKGSILALIGPNGAGKSTILKTVTGQLPAISGKTLIEGRELEKWPRGELAKKLAVVLTERIQPEMMSCFEVAAMGRYPYTGRFGALTADDKAIVWDTLRRVRADDIAYRDFSQISDGQRQRVLLARALCQQPEVLVLDEPTSFLDIRNKIELLDILLETAREKRTTVILSLHEIDLAEKVSDLIMCVRGDHAEAPDAPEKVFTDAHIKELYGLTRGSYLVSRGSVELVKTQGDPQVFVLGGAGSGLNHYRELQKKRVPFAAGILAENDMEYEVARALAQTVVSCPAFETASEETIARAAETMLSCGTVLAAFDPGKQKDNPNAGLLETARQHHMNIVFSARELQ
ncbi:MAG: ABC transporter ATP-binding protein [Clostridia bacterium]|nr:ABC transporter ATP-binding protein [Clostridia bacterium]